MLVSRISFLSLALAGLLRLLRVTAVALPCPQSFRRVIIATVGAAMGLCFLTATSDAACPPAGSGISLTGSGVTATEAGCTISTTAGLGYGIATQNQAQGTLNNSSITTTGTSAFGIYSRNGGIATVNGSAVAVSGSLGTGVYAIIGNATINLNNVSVGISSGVGINATDTGRIFGDGVTVTTNSDNGHGASTMRAGVIDLSNSNITINGINSYGISAVDSSQLTFRNGSQVLTTQDFEHAGYAARSSLLTIENSTVATQGTSAYGVYARDLATANVGQSTIQTVGSRGYGLISQTGSTISADGTSINTSGASAVGSYTFNGSRIDLNNSTIATRGSNAYAFYAAAPAGLTNTFNATDSNLNSSNGATFVISGGVTNVTLTRTQNNSGVNQLLSVNGGTGVDLPFDLTGVPTDFGPVGLPGNVGAVGANPSTLNFTADDSVLTGDTVISGNSSAAITLQSDTVLTGIFVTGVGSTSNMTLLESTWLMTGSSNLTTVTNDPSLIDFAPPTGDPTLLASYMTLTVNNYVGAGGTVALNTFLDTDGSPSDRLIIDTGTTSGTSLLRIKNTGGGGAETIGNGILVIDTINGGTTTANAFALDGEVAAGPYEYTLFRGSVDASNPDAFFLRSTINCALDPGFPGCAGGGIVPNYRPEISLYSVLPQMAVLFGREMLGTLHQRAGEQEQLRGHSDLADVQGLADGQYINGVWARAIGEHGQRDGGSAGIYGDVGPKFDYNMYAVEAGLDVFRHEGKNGHRDQAGAYVTFGQMWSDVDHVDHNKAGSDNMNAYTFGAYWTHFGPTGWYLDSVLQGTWYDIDSNPSSDVRQMKSNGYGLAASLEGGYPFQLPDSWIVEPQAQLVYQHIWFDGASDGAARIDFDGMDSLAGRLGTRVQKTWSNDAGWDATGTQRQTSIWGRVNIWNEFLGGSTMNVSSDEGTIPFKSNLEGTWAEVGLGASGQIAQDTTIYISAAYDIGLDGDSSAYNGSIGVRFNW